ncbi:RNA polymerase-associated protein RapA [Rhodoferax lithotrophicus]|uniref:RNA polymerase-associated protein RapA n=1 Tax=Rhodoferax lithotrophicus TaxID=2798804 RepID=A0ABM7MU13_9BURK|nr:DEAD/DEAH box helicase [Rhodoferax sp. MIZ03]BCO29878.1 RNA polymerase-associated protein RapA [Rhodoferax sp. MIZ03]
MPSFSNSNSLWLDLASLVQQCDTATYTRGLELYRNQRVLDLSIEPMKDVWLLMGDVQGTARHPYEVSIEVKRGPNGRVLEWDSDCTCPVGYQCKHGVALMIKAAYKGQQILGETMRPGRTATAEELEAQRQADLAKRQAEAKLEAERTVLSWLDDLDRQSAKTPDPTQRKVSTERHEQFLYLLNISAPQSASPQLTLEAVVSYPKVTGGWAKAKQLKFEPERGQPIFDLASDADHDVLQLMRAMRNVASNYFYSYGVKSRVILEGKFGVQTLELAASTGRLFVGDNKGQPVTPVVWGPPLDVRWQWNEVAKLADQDSAWTLRPMLSKANAKLCLNNPPLYLDSHKGVCGLAHVEGMSMGQIGVLLKTPPLKTEALKTHQAKLVERLGPVPMPPVLEQLKTLKGITPKACLHLTPVPAQDVPEDGLMLATLRFDYAGHRGWWVGQGSTVLVDDAQGRCLLHRDPPAELETITLLAELNLVAHGDGVFGMESDSNQEQWLIWADTDYAELRQAGFEITLDDALTGWIQRGEALNVNLQAQGDDEATSPWFDLSLGMEINGQRHNILPLLPELIKVAAKSPRDATTGLPELPPFVYLPAPTGGFIRLPTDNLKPWLGALLELVDDRSHDFSGDSLKLSRLDAMRTTASLGEGAVWQGAQHLRDMVQRLSGRAELPDVALPDTVHATLRPYQQHGVNWLQFLREYGLAGILADDMGLGKTLQTLAHIQIEKDAGRLTHPALIIAPVSLMGNWKREAERFCPGLRSLVHHGQDRHDSADSMAEHDIVIAPYSLLHRDRERWLEAQWHLVVLDEAQNIKNAATNAAQVASELKARHRLCLSGTPMENNLGEIWSLFHFLMPGFLGSQKRFQELFRNPIEKQGDPEALHQLRARVTPFMLRRTKALVANELPPKVETVMRVELSGKQADLYETIRLGMEKTVREALDSKGLAKSQITILDALLKLRQVCCDPHLLKLDAAKKVKTSAKLDQLMEMLPEMLAEGRRILLFSQFTSMLTLIEAELQKRGIAWAKLTGQSQKRDELIERFTSGEVPLFLISLKAGGVGLNLPQADTVIHFDPWWNPAVEAQATGRAHRIGQTQSVWVVKLVAQGTIEERILALQERKAALAESMYSGSVGRKQPLFSESDLAELLKPLSI